MSQPADDEPLVTDKPLIDRLRTWVGNPLCLEAADEIEQLHRERNNWKITAEKNWEENKRLRAALFEIIEMSGPPECPCPCDDIACRALEDK
jgi:hypothetical protein